MEHTNTRGKTFYLHTKEVTLRGGRKHRIYYFKGSITQDQTGLEVLVQALPDGYEVIENGRSGLPLPRKIVLAVVA